MSYACGDCADRTGELPYLRNGAGADGGFGGGRSGSGIRFDAIAILGWRGVFRAVAGGVHDWRGARAADGAGRTKFSGDGTGDSGGVVGRMAIFPAVLGFAQRSEER